jgi:hypothetical protein
VLHDGPYILALRDPAGEQKGGLPERGLQVERVQREGGVAWHHHLEPPQGHTRDGVVDADVGDRAVGDERVHASEAQEMVRVRSVDGVVADLADDELVLARLKLVDDLPASGAGPHVLRPDLPLRVALFVRVLRVDRLHPGLPGEVEGALYLWDRGSTSEMTSEPPSLTKSFCIVYDDESRFLRGLPGPPRWSRTRNLY